MRIASAAALVLLGAAAATAQESGAALKTALVRAMAAGDRAAVARLIAYPAVADVGGLQIPLADRAAALELYRIVFTGELRCELEKHPAVAHASGATLADGRVRAIRRGDALRVQRITVLGASAASAPSPVPQPAYFIRGQVQFSGRLHGDGVDAYLVTARKGAVLQARIEKFRGRAALVRVVDAAGHPLGKSGGEAPRFWAGTLPADGQYRVEVVRLAPFCDPPFTYLLTMNLR
jgi:hypothetical protein